MRSNNFLVDFVIWNKDVNTLDHFDIRTNIKDRNTNVKAKCKHCFSVIFKDQRNKLNDG